ncbi:MAG: glycine zipper 2TM domain-containing protein [Hydrogenophaga sp.]|nr:glycine zipper 2TM domain-containing protein [Hydrogenophaga sp.]
MKYPVLIPVMSLLAFGSTGVAHAQEEQGRVLSSTPVVQQVAVPREVCSDERVTYQGQPSGAGALIGGIAGGAAGNAIGNGSGRAAATVIGLIGGAIIGNRVEGPGQPYTESYRQCGTQTFYENRTVAYNVVYKYAGRQYNVQMPQDPGPYIRLNVSPADALPPQGYAPPVYNNAPIYRPQTEYYPSNTRITIGTQYYPRYQVSPGVIFINGHRSFHPGHNRHDSHRHRDGHRGNDRWDRNR